MTLLLVSFEYTYDNFSIIGTSNSNFELRILESLHIKKNKPILNRTIASYPLEIVK